MSGVRPAAVPRALRVAAATLLLAAACTGDPPGPPAGAPTLERMAREVGTDVVTWLRRGHVPGRSGEIALVAKPRNVISRRGSWVPGEAPSLDTSHSTPWAFHQRVPLMLWRDGPPVRRGLSEESLDVSALPGLLAAELRLDFPGRTPIPLLHRRREPLRAIVVVVWDGGGWNLLEEYPPDWPFLRSLMHRGIVFANATVGSSPSVTAAVHATMGTGLYPREHGIPDNTVRLPGGEVGDPWLDATDPALLEAETLADVWDRETGNEAWVGLLATEPWHAGLLGHGAALAGGDRDVAVLWDRSRGRWFTNPGHYALPRYLPGGDALGARLDDLDASDGTRDGRWRGNDLADPAVIPGTPAFVGHQGETLLEIVRREPIGEDEVADLLFVVVKSTDRGAHVWNLFGEEEREVLRAQDDMLADLVAALDAKVGRRRYLLAYTADHGLTPLPERVGGLRIHPEAVGARIEEAFGPIVDAVTPASVFLDMDEVRARGVALEDVARFLGALTYEDGLPDGVDTRAIPGATLRRRTIAAAFPGRWLEALTEEELVALGAGRYPEGDLTTPVR